MIIKPNEHYFLEIDSKILNNFIANNIFECPNKNELFNSLTQSFSNQDKRRLSLAVIGMLERECSNIRIEDVWYWLCNSSEIVIFKSKNAYKSKEQYNEFYKEINSEYLIDFKYEDIAKNFQNLGFESVTQDALNTIGIKNLVNIYMKNLQRRRNFEQKQILILLKFDENLVCIKLEYMDYLYVLVTNNLPSNPYSVLEISDIT